jgi:methionyl-tRNA synthetase
MSKSLGNVVRPQGYVERFGVDALRYFVMREMVLGQDANFADDPFLTRYNADLANDLGNVVSRVTTMIQRYCGGAVPAVSPGVASDLEAELTRKTQSTIAATLEAAAAFDFSQALRETWELISALNKYIVAREPWAMAKTPESRPLLDATLYTAADALRVVASLIEPVMPTASSRVRSMLGVAAESWTGLEAGTLKAGARLGPIEPLFPRMESSVEELRAMAGSDDKAGQPAAPNQGSPAPAPAPPAAAAAPAAAAPASAGSDRITIDDFMKVDLRVAKVLTAEKVPNSKKLVKMTIDVGTEQRTLVAGIAEAYEAEQLVGRTVAIVFNLKPAKLMGIESNGMVLAASPEGGKPMLVGFDQDVPPGTRIR